MSRLTPPPGLALGLGLLVTVLAGCGGQTTAPPPAVQPPVAGGTFLSRPAMAAQMSSGVDRALHAVAVMSQPGDDPSDPGPGLPQGHVRDTRCAPEGDRPAGPGVWRWRCSVQTEHVDGRREAIRYHVGMDEHGCFAAAAVPHRSSRYDATIQSYAEDPLDVVSSRRRGCP